MSKPPPPGYCGHCFSSGWIFADDKDGCEFGFRCPYCDCAVVKKIHQIVPVWDPARHGSKFKLRDFGMPLQKQRNEQIDGRKHDKT